MSSTVTWKEKAVENFITAPDYKNWSNYSGISYYKRLFFTLYYGNEEQPGTSAVGGKPIIFSAFILMYIYQHFQIIYIYCIYIYEYPFNLSFLNLVRKSNRLLYLDLNFCKLKLT